MEIINYDTLFEDNVALGFEKQFKLAEVIGEREWNVDLDLGKIFFGEDIVFDAQIVGSYSHEQENWLWVWDNEYVAYPEKVMLDAQRFKELGEKYNIDFINKSRYGITATDVHLLGMIMSGLYSTSAYYAGDYGDGIALLLLRSPLIDEVEIKEEILILQTINTLISIVDFNHERVVEKYLKAKGYTLERTGNQIRAVKANSIIVADFDELHRIKNINTEISK